MGVREDLKRTVESDLPFTDKAHKLLELSALKEIERLDEKLKLVQCQNTSSKVVSSG